MIQNIIIRDNSGQRWKVREAVSLEAVESAIAYARVTGSVGTTDIHSTVDPFTGERNEVVQASVHKINPNGTEVRPS